MNNFTFKDYQVPGISEAAYQRVLEMEPRNGDSRYVLITQND